MAPHVVLGVNWFTALSQAGRRAKWTLIGGPFLAPTCVLPPTRGVIGRKSRLSKS